MKILREQILFRQSALFVEVPTILQKNVSKGSERKGKILVRLVIWKTYVWNVRLRNDLDAYLKIIQLQNVQINQKRTRTDKRKYVLMKEVIVHATTAKITATKRYMHLLHVCMVMKNLLVEILVTVRN